METYFEEIVEQIDVQRQKSVESAILGTITQIIGDNKNLTTVELNEDAIVNALKKATARKPIHNVYPWSICPSCGGSIYLEHIQEHIHNQENTYCEHCGQAIDWSE